MSDENEKSAEEKAAIDASLNAFGDAIKDHIDDTDNVLIQGLLKSIFIDSENNIDNVIFDIRNIISKYDFELSMDDHNIVRDALFKITKSYLSSDKYSDFEEKYNDFLNRVKINDIFHNNIILGADYGSDGEIIEEWKKRFLKASENTEGEEGFISNFKLLISLDDSPDLVVLIYKVALEFNKELAQKINPLLSKENRKDLLRDAQVSEGIRKINEMVLSDDDFEKRIGQELNIVIDIYQNKDEIDLDPLVKLLVDNDLIVNVKYTLSLRVVRIISMIIGNDAAKGMLAKMSSLVESQPDPVTEEINDESTISLEKRNKGKKLSDDEIKSYADRFDLLGIEGHIKETYDDEKPEPKFGNGGQKIRKQIKAASKLKELIKKTNITNGIGEWKKADGEDSYPKKDSVHADDDFRKTFSDILNQLNILEINPDGTERLSSDEFDPLKNPMLYAAAWMRKRKEGGLRDLDNDQLTDVVDRIDITKLYARLDEMHDDIENEGKGFFGKLKAKAKRLVSPRKRALIGQAMLIASSMKEKGSDDGEIFDSFNAWKEHLEDQEADDGSPNTPKVSENFRHELKRLVTICDQLGINLVGEDAVDGNNSSEEIKIFKGKLDLWYKKRVEKDREKFGNLEDGLRVKFNIPTSSEMNDQNVKDQMDVFRIASGELKKHEKKLKEKGTLHVTDDEKEKLEQAEKVAVRAVLILMLNDHIGTSNHVSSYREVMKKHEVDLQQIIELKKFKYGDKIRKEGQKTGKIRSRINRSVFGLLQKASIGSVDIDRLGNYKGTSLTFDEEGDEIKIAGITLPKLRKRKEAIGKKGFSNLISLSKDGRDGRWLVGYSLGIGSGLTLGSFATWKVARVILPIAVGATEWGAEYALNEVQKKYGAASEDDLMNMLEGRGQKAKIVSLRMARWAANKISNKGEFGEKRTFLEGLGGGSMTAGLSNLAEAMELGEAVRDFFGVDEIADSTGEKAAVVANEASDLFDTYQGIGEGTRDSIHGVGLSESGDLAGLDGLKVEKISVVDGVINNVDNNSPGATGGPLEGGQSTILDQGITNGPLESNPDYAPDHGVTGGPLEGGQAHVADTTLDNPDANGSLKSEQPNISGSTEVAEGIKSLPDLRGLSPVEKANALVEHFFENSDQPVSKTIEGSQIIGSQDQSSDEIHDRLIETARESALNGDINNLTTEMVDMQGNVWDHTYNHLPSGITNKVPVTNIIKNFAQVVSGHSGGDWMPIGSDGQMEAFTGQILPDGIGEDVFFTNDGVANFASVSQEAWSAYIDNGSKLDDLSPLQQYLVKLNTLDTEAFSTPDLIPRASEDVTNELLRIINPK